MEMEANGRAISYFVVAITALVGVILLRRCCPRWPSSLVRALWSWRIHLIWTAGTPRLYKRRHAPERDSRDMFESKEGQVGVNGKDLKMLLAYIDEKDGGPPWHLMMDRSTPTLSFKAWRRDPKYGPTQYRSQIIFESMEPELLRDFLWDDEIRTKWDDMHVYFRILQEYPHTGTVIIHWIRKFPFFRGHREYIIGRRMWVSGSTYYCVSKSIPFPGIPRNQRPKRVDLYYSSWRIRAVKSRNGGHSPTSEVLLFHFEDIDIQKTLAKVGVQRGMWKLVEKLELGVRAYQMSRLNGVPPSRYALLARTGTQIPDTNILLNEPYVPEDQFREDEIGGFALQRNMLKWLLAGGILVSCGLKWRGYGKEVVCYIIQGIRDISSIAKQGQELRSASKTMEVLIQKAKSTASRQIQVVTEQSQLPELLARTVRVSQWRSRQKAQWPKLFTVVMKIFGW